MEKLKIKVNEDACIGCGACQAICPDVFELNDEGISTCLKNEIEDDKLKDEVLEAIESCPTEAIVKDDNQNN